LHSKCPPFALKHARRHVRHCLTAVSIMRWSSSSKAARIRECSSSTSTTLITLCRPSASRENFYAEKQHSNKVLPFGARGSGSYASPCVSVRLLIHCAVSALTMAVTLSTVASCTIVCVLSFIILCNVAVVMCVIVRPDVASPCCTWSMCT